MAYGHDVKFRERVVAAHAAGKGGVHKLAEVFGIGYRTVQRWLARQRTTGSVAAAPGAGGWKSPIGASARATGPAWRPLAGRAGGWGSCVKKTPAAK